VQVEKGSWKPGYMSIGRRKEKHWF